MRKWTPWSERAATSILSTTSWTSSATLSTLMLNWTSSCGCDCHWKAWRARAFDRQILNILRDRDDLRLAVRITGAIAAADDILVGHVDWVLNCFRVLIWGG